MLTNVKWFSLLVAMSLFGSQKPETLTPPVKPNAPPDKPTLNPYGKTRAPYKTIDRLANGDTVIMAAASQAPASAFRGGYFGMPVAIAPFDSSEKEQTLVYNGEVYYFLKNEKGFSLISKDALPEPPSENIINKIRNMMFVDNSRKEIITQNAFCLNSNIGFQLDELGDLYWIGSMAISKRIQNSWKEIYAFRNDFLKRNRVNSAITGTVVLPGNKLALFGGETYFIEILDLSPGTPEPKSIKAIEYEFLGCDVEGFPSRATPEYCITSGWMYFYLRGTGHFYRMNLDSFNIQEISVPWMKIKYGKKGQHVQWESVNSTLNIEEPIVPESISFSVSAEGSIHATALMFNMPMTTMHVFDLNEETTTIKSEIKVEEEVKDPNLYQDADGSYIPLRSARKVKTFESNVSFPQVCVN